MQLYAQERRRRFQSDLDVRDLRNDLDNVFRHNEEVEKQNAELTSKLASASTSSSEVDIASIQKENESLRAQVDSLTHECEDLQKLRRDSNTNQEEWKKEREEMVRVYLGSGEDATAQVVVDQDKLTEMLERVIGIMDWSAVSQNTPKDVMDREMSAPMLVKSVHAKRCSQGLTMVMRCTKAVTFDVRVGEGAEEVRERDERKRAAFALATFLNATLNPRKQLVAMWSGNETIITKYNNQKKRRGGAGAGDAAGGSAAAAAGESAAAAAAGDRTAKRGRITKRGARKRRNVSEGSARKRRK